MFKALNNSEGGAAEGQSSSSSSSPPEAIQLHTNRIIDFLHGTTVQLQIAVGNSKSGPEDNNNNSTTNGGGGKQQSRYYSALSYQAVQTQQDDTLISNNKNSTTPSSNEHLRPDLGIWDCRINNNNEMASAMLLKRVVMDKSISSSSDNNLSDGNDNDGENSLGETNEHKLSSLPPPIVMAVDISNPNEVQTIIEQMRSVVLNIYDDNDNSKNNTTAAIPNKSCTTTIKALQKCTFGSTKIQEEVTFKGSSTSNEERIALILAVIIPNSSTVSSKSTSSAADEYKERQAQALLLYHLHKFSLEVNCTLCFVSDKKGSTSGGDGGEENEANAVGDTDVLLGRSTTMSIDELGKVIRRVAMGLSPVEEDNNVIDQPMIEEEKGETAGEGKEDEEAASSSQRPPSIHVPGSHDGELIHGAYLRNASCEGRWDASKDDLNVALPPQSSTNVTDETKENSTGGSTSGGDEEWLSQLASSIGLSPESAASALSPKQRSKSPKQSLTPERKKKERPAVKKRVTRGTARNKEGGAKTPKDEKEVLNFFDNLLKSPKGVTPKQKKDEK